MLSDAELTQMLADAQRIEALRENATPGPWVFDEMGDWSISTPTDERGFSETVINTSREQHDFDYESVSSLANGRFIAATRTDPSAANVLRLVEEVRLLRNKLRLFIDHPSGSPIYFDPSVIAENVVQPRRDAEANEVITACHIHGVPVPEHLKAYEKGGE